MKKIQQIFIPIICLFCSNWMPAQNTGVVSAKNGLYSASISNDVCYFNGRYYSLGGKTITCWDQNMNIVWTTSINSTSASFSNASKIIITKDGNIVCGGITTNHSYATYVIKLDLDGNVLFQKEYYLSSLMMTLFAISPAAGEDEGFVLGGMTCSHNNLLMKLDKNGNVEWAKYHLLPNSSATQAIYPENNGYVITSIYPDKSGISTLIWATDLNGNPQWSHFLSASSYITPSFPRITKLSTGQLAFLCWDSQTSSPFNVCTFDPSGTNINIRQIGGYKKIELYGLAEDANGDLVLSGVIKADPPNDPNTQRSLYLKLNADGSVPWARQSKILPNLGPVLSVVHKTTSGKFLFFGDGGTLATVDQMGNGLCTADSITLHSTSVPFTEVFQSIIQNSLTILTDPVNYETGSVTLNKVILCNTVGIEELADVVKDLKVYPNPNDGNFNIQLSEQFNEGELIVSDQLGREVYSTKVYAGNNIVSVQGLSEGLYHFIISENRKPFTAGKFMVR